MFHQNTRNYRQKKRKFVICGNNGNSLVERALTNKGWVLSENEDLFHLKWTELKSHIDYDRFQEGKQLANHISSSSCITTKSGLLNTLRSYFGSSALKETSTELKKFFPETYRLSDCREQEKLLNTIGKNELWICKPTNSNQGKGIFLIKGKQDLIDYIERRKRTNKSRSSRIVQRYISSPLLLHGRKFDIRAYLLVGSSRPYNVFFHSGYLRLAVNTYDNESNDLTTHLTNQYVQKKHPNYSGFKNDTVWSMEQFQRYLDNEGYTERCGLKSDWVHTDLHERMKTLAHTIFKSAQTSLVPKIGLFDLYGLDFMLDESLNVWLLEVNTNPALHTHCSVLQDLLPSLIDETLSICIELFDKKVAGLKTFPIDSQKQFELIFSAEKDAMLGKIEFPIIEKQNGIQFINRGSELSPIQCAKSLKPSKSAPTRRNKPVPGPVKKLSTCSDRNSPSDKTLSNDSGFSERSDTNVDETSLKDPSASDNEASDNEARMQEKCKPPNMKTCTVPNPLEMKRGESSPPQIPYKLALIEVAPCPKQNVL
ncbi:hypothetical protein ACHWQZ_G015528 [Mnemiopsis leidyi]